MKGGKASGKKQNQYKRTHHPRIIPEAKPKNRSGFGPGYFLPVEINPGSKPGQRHHHQKKNGK
jgi:hypothetical protein